MAQNAGVVSGHAAQRHPDTSVRPSDGLRTAAVPDIAQVPYRRQYSPAVGLLLGFVAGSVFWHFVGFWDFVGRIVFHKPKAPIAGPHKSGLVEPKVYDQLPSAAAAAGTDGVTALGGAVAIDNCITIVRDPATGQSQSQACPAESVPMRIGTSLRRGDFARLPDAERLKSPDAAVPRATPSGWSTVTSNTP